MLRLGFIRAAAIIGISLGACYFAVTFTVASVIKPRNPELALAWWGSNAQAQALAAYQIVATDRSAAAVARARGLAQSSLLREPVNPVAVRTLAITATLSGDAVRGEQYMDYAERLSRRDVPTQLMLLEREVRRNNIPGALRHYDRALRVSTDIRETLLPIMVQAAAEPAIATEVGRLLVPRPPWWFNFAEHLVQELRAPGVTIFLLGRLRLDPQDERERSLIVLALRRMTDTGAYAAAERLYRGTVGAAAGANGNLVRNGGFDTADIGLPPFDWLYINESGLGAYRESDAARGGHVLRLVAESERGGEVARQLLTLPPGRYQVEATAGSVEEGSLSRLAVRCAGQGGASLATIALPAAPAAGTRFGTAFTVPAGNCSGQWLSVIAGPAATPGAGATWLDAISVRRN